MLRSVNITVAELMGEFCDDVSEFLGNWRKMMEESKGENERTKAHRTIKLIERFWFVHGV